MGQIGWLPTSVVEIDSFSAGFVAFAKSPARIEVDDLAGFIRRRVETGH
jgi:hypothetical protein